MTKSKSKTERTGNGVLYPVKFKGIPYYMEDCDELFVRLYTNQELLSADCSIRISGGLWLYPDGSSYDEELEAYNCNQEDEE